MSTRPHLYVRHDSVAAMRARDEERAGHADHLERGRLRADIEAEGDRRQLTAAQVNEACGLDPGALGGGGLSTPTLHAALRHLRGLPTP